MRVAVNVIAINGHKGEVGLTPAGDAPFLPAATRQEVLNMFGNIQEIEEAEFHHSSIAEWDAFEAKLEGEKHPDRCWILSDRDVWYRNPYYTGPEQPHPDYDEEGF